jgi:tetratricopeptide (TPR) repeat protein
MAINGSLREASLPDVLQLLAMGRKTGCLALTHRNNFGSIYFDAGRIAYASIVNRRDRIGERLVQSGVITAALLQSAIAEQGEQPESRLGDVLVARGDITREVLHEHVRIQVEETVYLLYTWNEGVFTFDAGARAAHEDLVSINPESLMLEGARRVDEWSLIASSIPGFDMVFAVQRRVPTNTLTSEQEYVLRYLDGRRDVTHVAEASGLTELDVGKVLHELLGAGIVSRVDRHTGHNLEAVPSGKVDEHRNLGVAFYRTAMFDEALREFRRVLELDPENARAREYCGLVLLRRTEWREAAEVYRELDESGAARASTYNNYAIALERLGLYADAAVALERAVELGGADDPRIHTSLGVAQLLGGDAEGANRELDLARARFTAPPPAAWYHYAALAAAWVGDLTRARTLLEEAITHHPHAAALHNNLAAVLDRVGEPAHALATAKRGLAEDASLPQLHKNAGDQYYRGGRYDEALQAFQRAVDLRPELGADVHLKMGNVHLRAQNRDEAADCWQRALELDPKNAIARRNLEALEQMRTAGAP